jgi:two-component system chemotaxis response regulator CheY
MKINVLIVEDDKTMRVLIKSVLIESGMDIGDIVEAENGKEGLLALENHKIDLMLVDIYMPVMDGMEMLDSVRDHPVYKNIPAIVVSMEDDHKRIGAIVRKGLGFVHKPLTKQLLKEEIKKIGGLL